MMAMMIKAGRLTPINIKIIIANPNQHQDHHHHCQPQSTSCNPCLAFDPFKINLIHSAHLSRAIPLLIIIIAIIIITFTDRAVFCVSFICPVHFFGAKIWASHGSIRQILWSSRIWGSVSSFLLQLFCNFPGSEAPLWQEIVSPALLLY